MVNKVDKQKYSIDIKPIFSINKKAIVFESSGLFVPYLHVALLSLLSKISDDNQYDIIILTNEIDDYDCDILLKLINGLDNVRIRFFDPTNIVDRYIKNNHNNYLEINYYRLALPWILSEYDIALNLGADIVIERDVIDLLKNDLADDKYIAGVVDLGYLGRLRDDICKEELGLSNPYSYVNADVLLFNLKSIRKNFNQYDVMDIWQKYKFRCAEQDALNVLFDDHVQKLDLKWNIFPRKMSSVEHIMKNKYEYILEWKQKLKNPYIIHYAAFPKPWDYPMVEYGDKWWNYARQSPYYEEIVRRMCIAAVRDEKNSDKIFARKCMDIFFSKDSQIRKFFRRMFPKKSFQREFLKSIYYIFFKNPNKEYGKKFGKLAHKKY